MRVAASASSSRSPVIRAWSFSVVRSASPLCSARMIVARLLPRPYSSDGRRRPHADRHDDAGTNRSCKKLFWIADPGKSQHIATFRDATQSGSGTRRPWKIGRPRVHALGDDGIRVEAITDHQQRISSIQLPGQGCAQRPGREYMLIADTTPGVDHGEREVLQQRRILQSVVHDDKARTLCARECCTGDTVPRHDNRGRLRDLRSLRHQLVRQLRCEHRRSLDLQRSRHTRG